MAETAAQIIQDGLLFGGVGDTYNPADGAQAALGLRILNNLTDSNSTAERTIFHMAEGTFPLVVTVASYNVPNATLTVRPVELDRVSIVDAQNVTHPVRIVGVDEWSQIVYKPATGRPDTLYNDCGAPTSVWALYPTPAFSGDVLHAWYWDQLQQFATVSDLLAAPPAFTWFLKTALGVAIAAILNKTLSPEKMRVANAAERAARRVNKQPKSMNTDLPLQNRGGYYNIYTDQP